jgi:adenylate kinase family enzyme
MSSGDASGVQRVSVIGVTGSGKTTFASRLAGKLEAPHVELDALHWEPHWTMAELEVFRARVEQAIAGERWVVEGNYSKVRDLVWGRADSVVWLDYPFALTFGRLVLRTIARIRSKQELWSGNRERFAGQFLARDSLFLWAIKTHRTYRQSIPAALVSEPYSHLGVVRFRAPRDAERWLETIEVA